MVDPLIASRTTRRDILILLLTTRNSPLEEALNLCGRYQVRIHTQVGVIDFS